MNAGAVDATASPSRDSDVQCTVRMLYFNVTGTAAPPAHRANNRAPVRTTAAGGGDAVTAVIRYVALELCWCSHLHPDTDRCTAGSAPRRSVAFLGVENRRRQSAHVRDAASSAQRLFVTVCPPMNACSLFIPLHVRTRLAHPRTLPLCCQQGVVDSDAHEPRRRRQQRVQPGGRRRRVLGIEVCEASQRAERR